MDFSSSPAVQRLLEALSANPFDEQALIGLARLRGLARCAVPAVMHSMQQSSEPRFRAKCMDVLSALLRDYDCAASREVVALLAAALDDPEYRRMRRKIVFTLSRIGLAAHEAIPVLARHFRAGAPTSVRFPLKCFLAWLAWECWEQESPQLQERTFAALEGFTNRQAAWILARMLETNTGGGAVRERARRTLAALTPPPSPGER